MKRVEDGDHVTITYVGELEDGEIFESTEDSGPLQFQVGSEEVMPGFEKALLGMAEGEEKTVTLQPEDAYGPKQQELTHVVQRSVFSGKVEPQPGMVLSMTVEKDGKKHQVPVMVTKVDGDKVVIDFNHPLAGKALIYRITLQAISEQPTTG